MDPQLQEALARIHELSSKVAGLEAVVQLLNSRANNQQISLKTLVTFTVPTSGLADATYTMKATTVGGVVTSITLV